MLLRMVEVVVVVVKWPGDWCSWDAHAVAAVSERWGGDGYEYGRQSLVLVVHHLLSSSNPRRRSPLAGCLKMVVLHFFHHPHPLPLPGPLRPLPLRSNLHFGTRTTAGTRWCRCVSWISSSSSSSSSGQ